MLTRSNDFMYAYTDTPLSLGERFQYIHPGYELREEYLYTNVVSLSTLAYSQCQRSDGKL